MRKRARTEQAGRIGETMSHADHRTCAIVDLKPIRADLKRDGAPVRISACGSRGNIRPAILTRSKVPIRCKCDVRAGPLKLDIQRVGRTVVVDLPCQ